MKEDNKIKYEKILEEGRYPILFLILIGTIGLIVRLYLLPFDLVLTNDATTYFWYASDVSILGKFPTEISPNIDTQFPNNGWPVFVSIFFSFIFIKFFMIFSFIAPFTMFFFYFHFIINKNL